MAALIDWIESRRPVIVTTSITYRADGSMTIEHPEPAYG